MSQIDKKEGNDRTHYAFNITLAAVAGQVGCLTLLIIVVALFAGLWLDARFSTKPLITVILMLGSVPVTLVSMFYVVKKATSRMKTTGNINKNLNQET